MNIHKRYNRCFLATFDTIPDLTEMYLRSSVLAQTPKTS